eukprot:9895542-Alexandrium_andersonii.AAC.1
MAVHRPRRLAQAVTRQLVARRRALPAPRRWLRARAWRLRVAPPAPRQVTPCPSTLVIRALAPAGPMRPQRRA